MQAQADYENERRWLSIDLLTGRVTPKHAFHQRLLDAGIPAAHLTDLTEQPCPPNIIGIDYYLTSDRVLDHRWFFIRMNQWAETGARAMWILPPFAPTCRRKGGASRSVCWRSGRVTAFRSP